MKPKHGEIWLADLNPRFGSEPGKVRPVVIVQTDLLNPYHTSTIICPITSQVIKKTDLLRVHLTKTTSGLTKPSDILVDQIRAIDNLRFVKKTGKLNRALLVELKAKLRTIMDMI
jgi:mRNA interferase MazF